MFTSEPCIRKCQEPAHRKELTQLKFQLVKHQTQAKKVESFESLVVGWLAWLHREETSRRRGSFRRA